MSLSLLPYVIRLSVFVCFSTPSLPSASSDEDIDPELREGIHNIMCVYTKSIKTQDTIFTKNLCDRFYSEVQSTLDVRF